MAAVERTSGTPRGPILLLAGQGFALGLTVAWILIPASAIFLAAYGSELLPATYIGAAVAGVVSSTLLSAAVRRRPLSSVATMTLTGLAFVLIASWLMLSTSDADWVSFALLVLVPITVPVGIQSDAELGQYRSHGCVRESQADAMRTWDFGTLGTPVIVTQ